MNKASFALLLLLAACSPAAEQPVVNEAEAPAAVEQEAAPVPELTGEWAVTGINGGPVEQAYAMGASVGEGRLTIHSQCVRMAWGYSQDRNIVSFTPAPVISCERGRTIDEDSVERAIGLANIAMFTDDGKEVQLSGSGGSVTLTRR